VFLYDCAVPALQYPSTARSIDSISSAKSLTLPHAATLMEALAESLVPRAAQHKASYVSLSPPQILQVCCGH
jgi:hypothetical protein